MAARQTGRGPCLFRAPRRYACSLGWSRTAVRSRPRCAARLAGHEKSCALAFSAGPLSPSTNLVCRRLNLPNIFGFANKHRSIFYESRVHDYRNRLAHGCANVAHVSASPVAKGKSYFPFAFILRGRSLIKIDKQERLSVIWSSLTGN